MTLKLRERLVNTLAERVGTLGDDVRAHDGDPPPVAYGAPSSLGPSMGTCQRCNERHRLDVDGLIPYHTWPRPTRMNCQGSRRLSVETLEADR